MRLVFMGTPDFAVPFLESLHGRHQISLVVTQPDRPKGLGRKLAAQVGAFNLHAARRVAPNDKQGREMLCRYILRPPLAKERLHLLADGRVTV